jgi:Tfp pilus assembly PilM family ATPase
MNSTQQKNVTVKADSVKKSNQPIVRTDKIKKTADSLDLSKPLTLQQNLNAKTYLAIDISTDRIYYAAIKKNNSSIQILDWGGKKLSGENVNRFNSTLIALQYIKSKALRFNMVVHVSFLSSDTHIRQIIIPDLPSAELKKSILYKNKVDIPNFAEDDVWHYQMLEKITEHNTKKCKVLVTVVPQKVIQNFMNLLIRAKLKPDVLIPRSYALSSIYGYYSTKPGNDVLLDISSEISQICLFVDGKLNFIRNFALGAINIDHVIKSTNNTSPKSNLLEPGNPEQNKISVQSKNIRERLLDKVQRVQGKQDSILHTMNGEILRSLEYFKNNLKNGKLSTIIVTGIGIKAVTVLPYFKKNLNHPIKLLSPNFTTSNEAPAAFAEYTCALGVALYDDKTRNLVPAEFKKKEIFKNLNIILTLLFIFFIGLAIPVTKGVYSKINANKDVLSNLKDTYLRVNPAEKEHEEILRQLAQIGSEKAALLNEVTRNPEVIQILKLFSNEVPKDIKFSGLRISHFKPENGNTPNTSNNSKFKIDVVGQVIQDYTMGDVVLINFINHLSDLSFFKDIKVSKKMKVPERKMFEFELTLLF